MIHHERFVGKNECTEIPREIRHHRARPSLSILLVTGSARDVTVSLSVSVDARADFGFVSPVEPKGFDLREVLYDF